MKKSAKNLVQFFLFLTFTIFSSLSFSASYEDYNSFLNRLGFESYSAQAKKTLENDSDLHDLAVRNLKANAVRYQVIDSARILTLVIVEDSFDRMNDPKVREKILNLTTYLLEPHPQMTREVLPEKITSITNQQAYVKARSAYLEKKMFERFWDEKTTLLGALADLAPSQNLRDIESLVDSYLRTKYMDWGLQQTRYWGRAMAASLVRYARLNGQPELEKDLAAKVSAKGLYLSNFLTSTVRYKNDNKEVVAVKIFSGDFVNEYARASDSYFISIGVEPSSDADRKFAEANNLIGKKRYITNYLTPEAEMALIDKVRDRLPLTPTEKRAYEYIQSNPPASGYSHVGMIEVRKDAASGIEMPWIWDVYPNSDLGGVRFIGLEGFAYIEKFRKVGFVHYDAKKFHQYYLERTMQTGYMPEVWKSWGAGLTDSGKLAEFRSKTYMWPAHISAAEVQRLQSFPSSKAESWYANEIVPRVLGSLKRYLVSSEALAFARNFANIQSAAYCSQIFVLAYLQGVNVDPQASVDRYSPLLASVQKVHPSIPDYFVVGERIVAPSGFAWQSRLVQKHVMIDLDTTIPVRKNELMLDPIRARLTETPLPDRKSMRKPPANFLDFLEDNF